MQNIAVFVATTAGPVRIERITPEGAPQSMICMGRTSDVLPICGDYDDFVRHGSGVILREFGSDNDRSYRLDASGPIDGGKSWQLGVYLAHAITSSQTAELSNVEDADVILWCSGTVDYDLNVGSVSHIARKIETSAHILSQTGIPILAILSADNIADAYELPAHIETLAPETAKEAAKYILYGAPKSQTALPKTTDSKPLQKRKSGALAWLGTAVVIGALAFIIWSRLNTPTSQSEGPPISTPSPGPSQDTLTQPASLPPSKLSSDIGLELANSRGSEPYKLGERLNLTLALNQDAWVYCFYQQSNGDTVQILPNPAFTTKHKQPKLTGQKTYSLPGDQLFPFDLIAAEPVGTDHLICFAADQDIAPLLPSALSGRSYEPLPEVLSNGLKRIFAEISRKTGTIRIQNSEIPIKIDK